MEGDFPAETLRTAKSYDYRVVRPPKQPTGGALKLIHTVPPLSSPGPQAAHGRTQVSDHVLRIRRKRLGGSRAP